MKKSPVYISGHYRSGTTLVSNILDKSDSLKITYGTIHYLRSYGKYEPISEKYPDLIDDTCDRLMKKWKLNTKRDEMKSMASRANPITNASVYDAMMRVFLETNDRERWGEKTNVNWEGMLSFLEMFPDGRCVHIIRDPRAVLASFKYFTFQPEPRYLDSNFAAMAMFDFISRPEIKNDDRILLIQYQDLVIEPERTIKRMCEHFGISFQPEMLDMTSKANAPYEANSSFHNSKSVIDTTSLTLWKDKLTNVDIVFTDRLLEHHMKPWGYNPLNIELTEEENESLQELYADPYIKQRLDYVKATGTGQQAFPDDESAYQLN